MWTRSRSKIGIVAIEATVSHGVDEICTQLPSVTSPLISCSWAVASGSFSSRDDRAVSERHAEQDE
jgi:hypothetical protein